MLHWLDTIGRFLCVLNLMLNFIRQYSRKLTVHFVHQYSLLNLMLHFV